MTSSPRRHNTNASQGRDQRNRDADVVAIPQTPPVQERAQAPTERIGDILRRVREKRGDDLGHIAEYLCIRRSYLEAIENSNYDKFPADAYVIGFLRSYAELLGLDGKETINFYRAEMAGHRKKPVLSMPTPMPEGRSPSVFILIGAAVTAILVYVLWYGLSSSDRASVSAPPPLPPVSSTAPSVMDVASVTPAVPTVPVVPVAVPAPVATAPAAPAATATPSAPPQQTTQPLAEAAASAALPATDAVKPAHLVIRATQSSWVMITNNSGETVFDRVLKPGETYKVPDQTGLKLTTGNGSGVVLTLDGADLPKLSPPQATGPSGVIRDIPLDTARLKALAQAR